MRVDNIMIINQARKYITLGLMGALLSSVALPVSALTPIEVAKLLASDGAPLDIFGYSVSLDGDSAVIGFMAMVTMVPFPGLRTYSPVMARVAGASKRSSCQTMRLRTVFSETSLLWRAILQ